jgi:hypothetical protein
MNTLLFFDSLSTYFNCGVLITWRLKLSVILAPFSFVYLLVDIIDSKIFLRLNWLTFSLKLMFLSYYSPRFPLLSSNFTQNLLWKKSNIAEPSSPFYFPPRFIFNMIAKNSSNSIVPEPSKSTAK